MEHVPVLLVSANIRESKHLKIRLPFSGFGVLLVTVMADKESV